MRAGYHRYRNTTLLFARIVSHVEQKVPRVEQKFHLSHFVETKYHVTTRTRRKIIFIFFINNFQKIILVGCLFFMK